MCIWIHCSAYSSSYFSYTCLSYGISLKATSTHSRYIWWCARRTLFKFNSEFNLIQIVVFSLKTPCVPMLPFLSVFVNLYLMMALSLFTWLRFIVWFCIGKKERSQYKYNPCSWSNMSQCDFFANQKVWWSISRMEFAIAKRPKSVILLANEQPSGHTHQSDTIKSAFSTIIFQK